jgi:hypothetical protein
VAVNWWHEYSFSGAWCQNSYIGAMAELGQMLGGVEGLLDGDSEEEQEEREEEGGSDEGGNDGSGGRNDGADDRHELDLEHQHDDGTSD